MEQVTSKAVTRQFYTPQQRQDFLAGFKKSGMSAREFSKTHNINESAFGKWLSRERKKETTQPVRLARKRAKHPGAPAEQSGFAELQVTAQPAMGMKPVWFAEVTSIRIYQSVSATYLKELQR